MLIGDIWAALAQSHGIELGARRHGRVADIVLSGPDLPATEYDIKTAAALSPSHVHRFAPATRRPRTICATCCCVTGRWLSELPRRGVDLASNRSRSR